jgi:hypothetical protein
MQRVVKRLLTKITKPKREPTPKKPDADIGDRLRK